MKATAITLLLMTSTSAFASDYAKIARQTTAMVTVVGCYRADDKSCEEEVLTALRSGVSRLEIEEAVRQMRQQSRTHTDFSVVARQTSREMEVEANRLREEAKEIDSTLYRNLE